MLKSTTNSVNTRPTQSALFPAIKRPLSADQIAILELLSSGAVWNRATISKKLELHFQRIAKAVGYRDLDKRAAFEQSAAGGSGKSPSLLTLNYVRERDLDIDGITEESVQITTEGRAALEVVRKQSKDKQSS